jgi:hypothetical protein
LGTTAKAKAKVSWQPRIARMTRIQRLNAKTAKTGKVKAKV